MELLYLIPCDEDVEIGVKKQLNKEHYMVENLIKHVRQSLDTSIWFDSELIIDLIELKIRDKMEERVK